jgi:hypothetical protein
MAIFLGLLTASGVLGRMTVKTPFSNLASILESSMPLGRRSERSTVPKCRFCSGTPASIWLAASPADRRPRPGAVRRCLGEVPAGDCRGLD